MIRRTLATVIDPGVRRIQKDADQAWRICRRQVRQLGRLRNARRRDQDQIAFLKSELRRLLEDRFTINVALGEANSQIENLTKRLQLAQRAHDQEEHRAARYRLAWVSCRQHRKQIMHVVDEPLTK